MSDLDKKLDKLRHTIKEQNKSQERLVQEACRAGVQQFARALGIKARSGKPLFAAGGIIKASTASPLCGNAEYIIRKKGP